MTRNHFLQTALFATLASTTKLRAAGPQMKVYKTPTCGCCSKWVDHLRAAGFEVSVQVVDDTSEYRTKAGIPATLASCHTGFVEGYGIEGHVPAAEIQRLLKDRPKPKASPSPACQWAPPAWKPRALSPIP